MNLHTQAFPAAIGAILAGGFFTGLIREGDKTFALVTAPKAYGDVAGCWNASSKTVSGADSFSHGMDNTIAMAEAGSELAQKIRELDIGGHTDWYIPARDELELQYRNLKPSNEENSESFRDGDNCSSLPVGYPYTAALPAQTTVEAFKEGGTEAFEPDLYWASTQYAPLPSTAWGQFFDGGGQSDDRKSYAGRARAVRRFEI